MTLVPLLSAPPEVQVHVLAALCALVLGPVAIWRKSRDRVHRMAGRVWVVAMLVVAGSSFLIHEARTFGPFSAIHLLSLLTLWGLWQGVGAILRRDFVAHGRAMRLLYAQALIGAGVFTLLPGRRMSLTLFSDAPLAGFVAVAAIGLAAAVLLWRAVRNESLAQMPPRR